MKHNLLLGLTLTLLISFENSSGMSLLSVPGGFQQSEFRRTQLLNHAPFIRPAVSRSNITQQAKEMTVNLQLNVLFTNTDNLSTDANKFAVGIEMMNEDFDRCDNMSNDIETESQRLFSPGTEESSNSVYQNKLSALRMKFNKFETALNHLAYDVGNIFSANSCPEWV